MRAFIASAILGLGTVAMSCGPAEPEYSLVATPGGRSFKLESISEVVRPNSETALLLNYQTDLDLADGRALESEVEAIWGYLRPEVENRGLQTATIHASQWGKPSWERRGRAVQYLIERSAEGHWAGRPNDAATTVLVEARPPGLWAP